LIANLNLFLAFAHHLLFFSSSSFFANLATCLASFFSLVVKKLGTGPFFILPLTSLLAMAFFLYLFVMLANLFTSKSMVPLPSKDGRS